MKILQIIRMTSTLALLSTYSYASENNVAGDVLQTEAAAASAIGRAPKESDRSLTESDISESDSIHLAHNISNLDYYFKNPLKAAGAGLLAGFGASAVGLSRLFDALRGYEIVDVTKQIVPTSDNPNPPSSSKVYEIRNLGYSQCVSAAKEGSLYIVGSPLIGIGTFLMSLHSFNNSGGSL